jgi:hypothetical protein
LSSYSNIFEESGSPIFTKNKFYSVSVSLTVHALLRRLIVLAGSFHSEVILNSFFAVIALIRTIVYGNEVGALSHGSYTAAIVVSTHCCSENKGNPGFGYCVEVEYEVHAVFITVVGKEVKAEGIATVGVGVVAVRGSSV